MQFAIFFSSELIMEWLQCFTFIYCLIFLSVLELSFAADTISHGQSITDGETLVSSSQRFELGFFSPGNSKNRYLGIWYYKISPKSVVWVANRKEPIADKEGVLTNNGSLVLLNQNKSIIWSSNSSRAPKDLVAKLLDSGNFVLRDSIDVNHENYMWQSFDYPSDTLLAGMKLGWDLKIGFERYLTAWRSADDPYPSDFRLRIEISEPPQLFISTSSGIFARSGLWDGILFGCNRVIQNIVFKPKVVHTKYELYYTYEPFNDTVLTRLVVNQSFGLRRFVSYKGSTEWDIVYSWPAEICDNYQRCGANGICRTDKAPMCDCLKGFLLKTQDEWDTRQTENCVKQSPKRLDCRNGEGFVKLERIKLPDNSWYNQSINSKECRTECLKNCSCRAYANLDISGKVSGCLMWYGDLIDIKDCPEGYSGAQDIFIRVPASELDNDSHKTKTKKVVLVVSIISGMAVLGLALCTYWKKREGKAKEEVQTLTSMENRTEDMEVPLFDLATIAAATNNFSEANEIGQGGFGPVYKGYLSSGQEIAVKRLSQKSGQGLQEFMNEVVLISKLQHRNLVALVGSCIDGDERMLIYEYMPNKSLDYFIFDRERRKLLSWKNRFDIIIGIARGLLYLHQDSKLQIVHRDLKTSNILLDNDLNPKISDFGLARIFRHDDKEVNTKRIVGTYGYMSPEYATEGTFSLKSDVYSLGVVMLEIISGKRNKGFHHPDDHHNLTGHAWLQWNDERALELMDRSLKDSFIKSQVQRCIHVGLLCVQKFPQDRPEMGSIVFMLANEEVALPQPKQPGFFIERDFSTDTTSSKRKSQTQNELSITMQEGR